MVEIAGVRGTVKSYSTKKGFGFIDCQDERPEVKSLCVNTNQQRRDVFVYNTHLVGRVGLIPGEEVEFTLCFDGTRPQARNVRVTNAAPTNQAVNARENPFEALTDAIQRPEGQGGEGSAQKEGGSKNGGERAMQAPAATTSSPAQRPAEAKAPNGAPLSLEDVEKISRDAALKAQAAQAIEQPTTRGSGLHGVSSQTLLEEQIRAAQNKAVDDKRLAAAAAAALGSDPSSAQWALWDQSKAWGEGTQPNQGRGRLPKGTKIAVKDFPAQDLVGQKGVVVEYDASQDRYVVEIEVPKKKDSLVMGDGDESEMPATTKTKLRLNVNQLKLEEIPVPKESMKELISGLSANAEPFNPMAPSILEWAAMSSLSQLDQTGGGLGAAPSSGVPTGAQKGGNPESGSGSKGSAGGAPSFTPGARASQTQKGMDEAAIFHRAAKGEALAAMMKGQPPPGKGGKAGSEHLMGFGKDGPLAMPGALMPGGLDLFNMPHKGGMFPSAAELEQKGAAFKWAEQKGKDPFALKGMFDPSFKGKDFMSMNAAAKGMPPDLFAMHGGKALPRPHYPGAVPPGGKDALMALMSKGGDAKGGLHPHDFKGKAAEMGKDPLALYMLALKGGKKGPEETMHYALAAKGEAAAFAAAQGLPLDPYMAAAAKGMDPMMLAAKGGPGMDPFHAAAMGRHEAEGAAMRQELAAKGGKLDKGAVFDVFHQKGKMLGKNMMDAVRYAESATQAATAAACVEAGKGAQAMHEMMAATGVPPPPPSPFVSGGGPQLDNHQLAAAVAAGKNALFAHEMMAVKGLHPGMPEMKGKQAAAAAAMADDMLRFAGPAAKGLSPLMSMPGKGTPPHPGKGPVPMESLAAAYNNAAHSPGQPPSPPTEPLAARVEVPPPPQPLQPPPPPPPKRTSSQMSVQSAEQQPAARVARDSDQSKTAAQPPPAHAPTPKQTPKQIPKQTPPKQAPAIKQAQEMQGQLANAEQGLAYDPSMSGNPGFVGALWKARKLQDFPFVIIRAHEDVGSDEIGRLHPNQTCVQAGPMVTLDSGVVRMPVQPCGYVSVHARLLNGPTFLRLATRPKDEEEDEDAEEYVPQYERSELLQVGTQLGQQHVLDPEHPMAKMKAMRMPEMCRDYTTAGKQERREAREAKYRERQSQKEEQDRHRAAGAEGGEEGERGAGGEGDWKNGWDDRRGGEGKQDGSWGTNNWGNRWPQYNDWNMESSTSGWHSNRKDNKGDWGPDWGGKSWNEGKGDAKGEEGFEKGEAKGDGKGEKGGKDGKDGKDGAKNKDYGHKKGGKGRHEDNEKGGKDGKDGKEQFKGKGKKEKGGKQSKDADEAEEAEEGAKRNIPSSKEPSAMEVDAVN